MKRNFLWSSVVAIICFLMLWWIYGDVLIYPNRYLLSDHGEAIKSYYVVTSKLQEKDLWVNTKQINYPFGEHLTYLDAQPVNTSLIKWVSTIEPTIANYGVGLINIICLYSVLIGGLFMFWLLRRLGLKNTYAATVAISIMMINPQAARISWQHALSISCFIPILLYLLTRYSHSKNNIWAILLSLNSLYWYFVHPYLGFMTSLFILLFILINSFLDQKKITLKGIASSFILSIIPTVIFLLLLTYTDHHKARVASPEGLIFFSSHFESVFFSYCSPISDFYALISGKEKMSFLLYFDAWSYIGIMGTSFLVGFVVKFIKVKAQIRSLNIPNIIWSFFLTSFILLIISFAFPFKWFPESISFLDYLPGIKQFRSLGRLSWFFVYCTYILMGYSLFKLTQTRLVKKNKYFFSLLFYLVFAISAWEGHFQHKFSTSDVAILNPLDKKADVSPQIQQIIDSIPDGDFQAVVPIPYYHIENHNFKTFYTSPEFLRDAFVIAKHHNLPITSNYAARASKEEAVKSLQFFSEGMFYKSIQKEFNSKPLLIIYDKCSPIKLGEERLITHSDIIYEDTTYLISTIKPKLIWKSTTDSLYNLFLKNKSQMTQEGNLWYSTPHKVSLIRLDLNKNNKTLFGDSTYQFIYNDTLPLISFEDTNITKGTLSFWYNHENKRGNVNFKQLTTDINADSIISERTLNWPLRTTNVLNNWMLIEFDISTSKGKREEFYVQPIMNSRIDTLYISKLMLRTKKSEIYEQFDNQRAFLNNRPLFHYRENAVSE